ncbi:hypothetical protein [Microbacterium telephonicum]|uniref:Uncharacterized protein n=1 Tax=Microbacterium telephonicum TaxID=1714841 RepID=A0A498BVG9_9MICO|nr:hypothetical protein [Microbacterium telephonicum]RLK47452.1 hypothetical protein C7474_2034 [Microbacterium telephonicum]
MDHALDAVLEIFSWIGFAGAALFGVVWLIVWAADGSWAQAEAIVDRDGAEPVVRWFGADGAHVAPLTPSDAATLADADDATIWFRLGRPGLVRLERRPAVLRLLAWASVAFAVLGVLTVVGSVVVLFVRG